MRLTLWDPQGDLAADLDILPDLFSLLGLHLEIKTVICWTINERRLAYDWAMREHLAASDNVVQRRPRPSFTKIGVTGE